MKQLSTLILFILTVGLWQQAQAGHTMGGEVSYECLGNNQYRFTVVFYRDCSPTSSGAGLIPGISISSASCGINLSPTLLLKTGYPVTLSLGGANCTGAGVQVCQEQFVYEATATLVPCSDWEILGTLACCRNNQSNIPNSTGESQGVLATLNNAAGAGGQTFCNSSPEFFGSSAHALCINNDYTLNPGVYEPDGDSLAFSFQLPRNNAGATINYSGTNTVGSPIPSNPAMSMDPNTGEVTIRPTVSGTYTFAMLIEEYRGGVLVGSSSREYQITAIPCPSANQPPVFYNPTNITGGVYANGRIDVCPNTPLSFQISAEDFDTGNNLLMWDSVSVSWLNFAVSYNNAGDSATATLTGTSPATAGNHKLILYLRDDACPIFATATFAINISVRNGTAILGNAIQYACNNGSKPAILTASGGTTFNWSIVSGDMTSLSGVNNTLQSIRVTPTASTVYMVTTDFLCGNATPQVTVDVVSPPTTTVSADTAICDLNPIPLSVTAAGGSGGPFTYSWAPAASLSGATTTNPTAAPVLTTRYTVSVFDPSSGCIAYDDVTVYVDGSVNLAMNPTISSPTYAPGDPPIRLHANISNGDCSKYNVVNIPYSPTAVNPTGGTVIPLGIGSTAGPLSLGFNMDFFCNAVSSFYVSSGGWISFSNPNGNPSTGAQSIPNAGVPDNMIAFLWGDFVANPFGGQFLNYIVSGTAPNRVGLLTLTNGLSINNNNNQNTVQLKMFEATGDVEVHVTRATTGANSTIGVEGPGGNSGVAAPGRNQQSFTIGAGQEEAWRFSPDQGVKYRVDWIDQFANLLIGTGDSIQVTPAATTRYCAILSVDSPIVANCPPDTVCLDVSVIGLTVAGPVGPQLIGAKPTLNATYNGATVAVCDTYLYSTVPYAYTPPGGTVLNMGDDDTQGPFPLGFNFDWGCSQVSQIWINSNGWVSFSNPNLSGSFFLASIPSNTLPDDFISLVSADLEPNAANSNAQIRYETVGTVGNRRFIVTYENVPYYASSNTVTVQLVLEEATGWVEIHTEHLDAEPNSSIIQGLQLSATNGVAVPGRNGAILSNRIQNQAARFRPQGSNLIWSWTSSVGPGMLEDSTLEDPTTVSLQAANSFIEFYVRLWNGSQFLFDTITVEVGPLPASEVWLQAVSKEYTALLDWVVDVDEYQTLRLEHQYAGERFVSLGDVSAMSTYRHNDLDAGVHRYRLVIHYPDGSQAHSNTIELSVGNPSEPVFELYPNPANRRVTISHPEIPYAEVLIVNLQGKQLRRFALGNSGATTIDLEGIPAGSYIINIRSSFGSFSRKLLVE